MVSKPITEASLSLDPAGFQHGRACIEHSTIRNGVNRRFGNKYHIVTVPRSSAFSAYRPESSLCRIAPHSIAQLFSCYKSNTTLTVVFTISLFDQYRRIRRGLSLSLFEHKGNLITGFDDIQRSVLHAEALAALCTTRREHGTTALGGHTGTEAVALSALARIRLIRTFHNQNPLFGNRVTSGLYLLERVESRRFRT